MMTERDTHAIALAMFNSKPLEPVVGPRGGRDPLGSLILSQWESDVEVLVDACKKCAEGFNEERFIRTCREGS